tara:strand:+ start:75 stop:272 length:198 start_codon:yes stop_codon:yes gene_type:complete
MIEILVGILVESLIVEILVDILVQILIEIINVFVKGRIVVIGLIDLTHFFFDGFHHLLYYTYKLL